MVYLTRVEHFNAAHKLYNAKWSEEENKAVFGKCCNPHFHGHNFDLFVTVKGEPHHAQRGKRCGVETSTDVIKQPDHIKNGKRDNSEVEWEPPVEVVAKLS